MMSYIVLSSLITNLLDLYIIDDNLYFSKEHLKEINLFYPLQMTIYTNSKDIDRKYYVTNSKDIDYL